MDKLQCKSIVEAALLTANRPLSLDDLLSLFDLDEQICKVQLQAVLRQLQHDCATRAVELVAVASGWRYQAHAAIAPRLDRLWPERPGRSSRALLETLALIAYRQPITRAEIEQIRGVAVNSAIIKSLQERNWIKIAGYRDVPGRPALLITTRQFLDDFNLESLAQLPALLSLNPAAEADIDG